MGFTLNDLSGSQTLTAFNWYHIAFVYNYQTQQQILYLNGVQDTIKSNAQPYQGTNDPFKLVLHKFLRRQTISMVLLTI
jgi:hypothetical protein